MTTREQIKAARDAMPKWQTVSENLTAPPILKINWWQPHEETIRALLSGDIAALRAACPDGYAVVPRVATEAMLKKARFIAGYADNGSIEREPAKEEYAAMVEAEHPAEKGNG